MGATEQKIFPDDRFNPHRFNDDERNYLLRHLGETPRVAFGKEKVKKPANEAGLRIALQRVFEEKDDTVMLTKMRQGLELALELDVRKREETRRYGSIDYSAMGVGCGPGETNREEHFSTDMSPKFRRPNHDPIKDLRAAFEGESDEEIEVVQARGLSALSCPWCDDVKEGPSALQSLQMHVMRGHPPHWDEFKTTIGPALRKGDIGPLMAASEAHEAEDEAEPEKIEEQETAESDAIEAEENEES